MFKFIINPKYKSLEDFIRQIPNSFTSIGRTIYGGRNIIKVVNIYDNITINVKQYHPPRFINAIVYSMYLRKPKGWRAYFYAERLLDAGIETPTPIAYIEERKYGIIRHSYFISIQSDYSHMMYEFGNASQEQYQPFAKAFAKYTAFLHSKGILHLDYSPGNILWEYDGVDYKFSLVDINRMYFGSVNMKMGCKNFARFWGPKNFLIMMIEEYARVCNYDIEECTRLMLAYRSIFWHRYSRKHNVEFNLEY